MKKILAILLAAVMIFGMSSVLAGCSQTVYAPTIDDPYPYTYTGDDANSSDANSSDVNSSALNSSSDENNCRCGCGNNKSCQHHTDIPSSKPSASSKLPTTTNKDEDKSSNTGKSSEPSSNSVTSKPGSNSVESKPATSSSKPVVSKPTTSPSSSAERSKIDWRSKWEGKTDPRNLPDIDITYRLLKVEKCPNGAKKLESKDGIQITSNRIIGTGGPILFVDTGIHDGGEAKEINLSFEKARVSEVEYYTCDKHGDLVCISKEIEVGSKDYTLKTNIKGQTVCYASIRTYSVHIEASRITIWYLVGTLD